MKTKTKKPKGPKRLNLSQLCEKHNIPMWPKAYRTGLILIAGSDGYKESAWVISRVVLRCLHREGHISHDPIHVGCGGITWRPTPKGLVMCAGIAAVEAERAEQKILGHGLPITTQDGGRTIPA